MVRWYHLKPFLKFSNMMSIDVRIENLFAKTDIKRYQMISTDTRKKFVSDIKWIYECNT